MRSLRFVCLFVLVLFSLALLAGETAHTRMVTTARAIEWQAPVESAATLSVQRPDGDVTRETFAAGRTPILALDGLADGSYSYELRFTRDSAPVVESGSFSIAHGALVPSAAPERNLRTSVQTLFTDFVSAQGGVCAGVDCTSTETFSGATAKVKANNTRIKFEDTSTSPGFPTTDWQLSANDTFSGGLNKLFVEDLTAATVPFLIEGGTPTNALYVDSTGRIGLGTSTPAKDLTISVPLSATIQMEQNASPFQTWDIVANASNFYVRDVNHEGNPFIIKTTAPNNSLVVDATGNIGLGVATPAYSIQHSSGARLDAGNWINASSRDVKQDIQALGRDAAFEALRGLEPVTFAYKANPGETNVGFIAEDVPALVATADRKGLSSMDIVAVLTKVVKEQQRTIEDLQTRLESFERQRHE